jgi:hypothetical protein
LPQKPPTGFDLDSFVGVLAQVLLHVCKDALPLVLEVVLELVKFGRRDEILGQPSMRLGIGPVVVDDRLPWIRLATLNPTKLMHEPLVSARSTSVSPGRAGYRILRTCHSIGHDSEKQP